MKKIVFAFILTLATFSLFAQQIEKFFDYAWKPCEPNMARFIAVIKNTDSGWVRNDYFVRERSLQMKGLYKDSACKIKHGLFYFFHPNGIVQSAGRYKDDKKEGLWLSYHDNKMMSDSTVYEDGDPVGTSMGWYKDGTPSDSTARDANGLGVAVEWFENGNVSSAGRLNASRQLIGKWQFFHQNGQVSALETYDNGKLVDKKYYSETGQPMDTTDRWAKASFAGGIPAWTKYLERNLYWPPDYKIVNGDKAVVVVGFSINEKGEIADAFLKTPFHPAFDKIALLTVKRSPKWLPAFNHNRKVKYNWTQTINFTQTEQ